MTQAARRRLRHRRHALCTATAARGVKTRLMSWISSGIARPMLRTGTRCKQRTRAPPCADSAPLAAATSAQCGYLWHVAADPMPTSPWERCPCVLGTAAARYCVVCVLFASACYDSKLKKALPEASVAVNH
eukprot:854526-Prymnesium_polylepis.3